MSKKCDNCVAEFLKGATSCKHCRQELQFDKLNKGRKTGSFRNMKSLLDIENDENSVAFDDDFSGLRDLLYNWKNPTAIHIAGSLICLTILIATFC